LDGQEPQMTERETVTLELDREAIEAAESNGLDLSAILLEAIYRRIPELHADKRTEHGRLWYEQNREAIESMNRMIETDGFVFSDGARTF
jgi:post-segregation antitoxin (ccd killing protein)